MDTLAATPPQHTLSNTRIRRQISFPSFDADFRYLQMEKDKIWEKIRQAE